MAICLYQKVPPSNRFPSRRRNEVIGQKAQVSEEQSAEWCGDSGLRCEERSTFETLRRLNGQWDGLLWGLLWGSPHYPQLNYCQKLWIEKDRKLPPRESYCIAMELETHPNDGHEVYGCHMVMFFFCQRSF